MRAKPRAYALELTPSRVEAIQAGNHRPHGGSGDEGSVAAITGGSVSVDVADGLLLDVRDISITDLDDESGLDRALARILASNTECNFNSFGSCIAG